MSVDIKKIKTASPIKNGALIFSASPKSKYFVSNSKYATNYPQIDHIENKYNNRFDDPSYYHGGGGGPGIFDGGDLDNDVDENVDNIYDGGTYEG